MPFASILLLLSVGVGYGMRQRQKSRRHKRTLIQQLYSWAENNSALESDLQQWLQRLPADEAAVLVELLVGYCASLNWEFEWLFAEQIGRAPRLKQALEENVATYIRAIVTSLQMEQDVQAYQAYIKFANKPAARNQRTLVQKLYPRLQAQGLTTANQPASKLNFLPKFIKRAPSAKANKPPTQREQIAAIQRAFDQNPALAMEAFKQTLSKEIEERLKQSKPQLSTTGTPALSMT